MGERVRRSVCVRNAVNMQYYMFVILIFASPQVYADEEGDVMSCVALFNPENIEQNCCEAIDLFGETIEKCKPKNANEEYGCEQAKCYFEDKGVIKGDTIDEKKVRELIEKSEAETKNMTEMHQRVKDECLNGKFEEYPPKDVCPLIRFQICVYIQTMVSCPSWKNSAICKKLSEDAKRCKGVLAASKK